MGKPIKKPRTTRVNKNPVQNQPSWKPGSYRFEFINPAQKLAWATIDKHDMVFIVGCAGTGKSHLAAAYAVSKLLTGEIKKIYVTRPMVEAEEKMGFLPGDMLEKTLPYMIPIYECIEACVGKDSIQAENVKKCLEVVPLAFMRGRSLLNSTLIPTPGGYVKMGDIQVGNEVIGSNGKPTKVLNVYPQGELPVYKMTFSDKTYSICSADHLWNTMTLSEKKQNEGFTTKTTEQIMQNVLNENNQKNHKMPVLSGPVQYSHQEVPFNPYLMGVLLGHGHIGEKQTYVSNVDQELLDKVQEKLPDGHLLTYKGQACYRLTSSRKQIGIKYSLKKLGLSGLKSLQKFVPEIYKFNSVECRLQVLQGLMDTDGWVCEHRSGKSQVQFCSKSKQLADDVMFLVRSLGGHAYSRKRDNPTYRVDIMLPLEFNPFSISTKADRWNGGCKSAKLIASIHPDGNGECTCIQVEAADSLFLTEDFIVTHNTLNNAVCILDEAQNCTRNQIKLFLTRLGVSSKMIVTGDPMQSDLNGGSDYLMDVVDDLESVEGIGIVKLKADAIVRHPLVGKVLGALERQK